MDLVLGQQLNLFLLPEVLPIPDDDVLPEVDAMEDGVFHEYGDGGQRQLILDEAEAPDAEAEGIEGAEEDVEVDEFQRMLRSTELNLLDRE